MCDPVTMTTALLGVVGLGGTAVVADQQMKAAQKNMQDSIESYQPESTTTYSDAYKVDIPETAPQLETPGGDQTRNKNRQGRAALRIDRTVPTAGINTRSGLSIPQG